MPIRKDLRRFYGREWREVTRPRILRRAGGRFTKAGRYLGGALCEQCSKPDRQTVFTYTQRVVLSPTDIRPFMFWVAEDGDGVWRNQFGQQFPALKLKGLPRKIQVILQIAHLNHVPGQDEDHNLKALCGWCHLHYDALHHRHTRSRHKDAGRPLLALAASPPRREDFDDEIDFCRAMQRWAVVHGDDPLARICLDDWFSEELLILAERETLAIGSAG